MMDLREWLIGQGETVSSFAARAGVSHATISRIVNRRAKPGGDLQRRIWALTQGQVTPEDFAWTIGSEPMPRFPRVAAPTSTPPGKAA